MKLVSIVVPVYNGEAFIEKCLDSLIDQTGIDFEQVEIIAINDGSKDKSLTILHQYAANYPAMIKVIDRENKGAAASRNEGIERASGRYVALVDQDDWVNPDYFEKLLKAAKASHSEVVQVGYTLVNASGEAVKEVFPVETNFGKLLAIPAWAKLYDTAFLRRNNITFFENNIGEDSLFTLKVFLFAKHYKTLRYAGYNNFFDNRTNVTNTLHKGLSEKVNIIHLLNEMKQVVSPEPTQQTLLEYNLMRTALYYLLSYGRFATAERFIAVNAELFTWFRQNIPNFKVNKYIWRKPAGEHASASLGIKLIMLVNNLHMVSLFAKVYCKK